jgi:hypothetical protein
MPKPLADSFRYGRTDRDPVRQTGVRFSACTFVQVKPRQALPPAPRQEIADRGVTAPGRLVPDRSYFEPHGTQCSPILTTFTPGFRAARHRGEGRTAIQEIPVSKRAGEHRRAKQGVRWPSEQPETTRYEGFRGGRPEGEPDRLFERPDFTDIQERTRCVIKQRRSSKGAERPKVLQMGKPWSVSLRI